MTERPAAGFLPVDKPVGPTSHDIVGMARRALGERRIGHTGTLDPFASGLLLLAVGWATRLAEYMADLPKSYTATVRLGAATDTDDPTGSIIASSGDWENLDTPAIRAALDRQTGQIDQLPPAYSAKKIGGRKMYEAARAGEALTARPSRVTIHEIEIRRVDLPDIDLEITCGTGTYIRAIARDVGNDLGVFGHLVNLRRIRIGRHQADRAVQPQDLGDPERVAGMWIDPAAAIDHMQTLQVDEGGVKDLAAGRAVGLAGEVRSGTAAAIHAGSVVAIGELGGGQFRPRKVFVQ